jgi:cbb3-type cytochrome oxidase subunit 3
MIKFIFLFIMFLCYLICGYQIYKADNNTDTIELVVWAILGMVFMTIFYVGINF